MAYVHGYSERESARLADQADVLRQLLHHDTGFPPGARVLEVGCGTGEGTLTLLRRSPGIRLTCLDVSASSLAAARARVEAAGFTADFVQASLFDRPLAAGAFDHAFLCFVLEHLPDRPEALRLVRAAVRSGGTAVVIEGDHGGCTFHPDPPAAQRVWRCLSECQIALGGDPFVGRRLHPLLSAAGFRDVTVCPRIVYCDMARSDMMEAFVHRTILPMVEGTRRQALESGLIDADTWMRGVAALGATGGPGGAFFYPFFKAVARVP